MPESPEFVRVRSYESQMVIRPHKSFDEVSFISCKRCCVEALEFSQGMPLICIFKKFPGEATAAGGLGTIL